MLLIGVSLADLAALGTAIQTVLIAAGLVYGFRQVQEARRARESAVILDVFQRLHSRDASRRRHRIYHELPDIGESLPPDLEDDLRQVINEFDLLGYLVVNGVLPQDAVLELYYATVIRVWRATSPYIQAQRESRGTLYAQYFERIVRSSRRNVIRRRPSETVFDIGEAADQT